MASEFSVLGKDVVRKDAIEKVKGEAKYIHDIQLPRMLHAKFLRSPHAHARIVSIDSSKAEAMPGVKCALTYRNVPQVRPLTASIPNLYRYRYRLLVQLDRPPRLPQGIVGTPQVAQRSPFIAASLRPLRLAPGCFANLSVDDQRLFVALNSFSRATSGIVG